MDKTDNAPRPGPGAYAALGGVAFGWGTIPVLVDRIHLPSSLIVAGRLWLASLCLALVIWRRDRRARATGMELPPRIFSVRPLLCLIVAGLLACHWLALFAAYRRAPAGTVILIVYLAPVGIAALAPSVLGERLTAGTVLALVVATAGAVLVAGPAAHRAGAAGLALAFLAAVLYVGLVLASKPLAQIYGGLHLALVEMGGAGAIMVPVAAAAHWPAPRLDWLWLLVLGLVHTAFGITFYLATLARLPATHVGIVGYLEPVGVVFFGWVLLSQRPSWETAVGGALVLGAGAVLVTLEGRGQRVPGSRPGESLMAATSAVPPTTTVDDRHEPTADAR